MHFFKKLGYVMGLLGFSFALIAQDFDQRRQDLACVMRIFDKALNVELARIAAQITSEPNGIEDSVDLNEVDKLIRPELATIKTKFAHVFNHELNQEQQDIVINLLRNLKAISVITLDDLMAAAEGCSTIERRKTMDQMAEKYCPELVNHDYSQDTPDIARLKEFEKVDLHDVSFNALKSFMCKAAYLEDMELVASLESHDNKYSMLQKSFIYVAKRIAFPFVVFNDFYFINGWQSIFKETGDMFVVMHYICDQLIISIDQQ